MGGRRRDRGHRFGGEWTERKLKVLARYLASYTTALKNKPFEKLYIDAFAGTGYREERPKADARSEPADLLFPDLAATDPQTLLDGSVRRALMTEPRFDRYVFIEQSQERCKQLEARRTEFPALAQAIEIRHGDANAEIQRLCSGNWRSRRAVLFLDPYGMQVEWTTIEAIAQTKAIDLWVLFPLGMGVNRLLKKTGEIPAAWRTRLDVLLGTKDWYHEFYRVQRTSGLFGDDEEHVIKKASLQTIGRYFTKRLEAHFAGVAEPGMLRNSRRNPLYLLCFAVGNPGKAKPLALRIANHLLKDLL